MDPVREVWRKDGRYALEAYQFLFESLEKARNEDLPEWAAAWDELRMVEATGCIDGSGAIVATGGACRKSCTDARAARRASPIRPDRA